MDQYLLKSMANSFRTTLEQAKQKEQVTITKQDVEQVLDSIVKDTQHKSINPLQYSFIINICFNTLKDFGLAKKEVPYKDLIILIVMAMAETIEEVSK